MRENFKFNISSSDQSFEKKEEVLIDFKEEHHDELRKVSLVLIQNKVLTLTSEHISSAYHFKSKYQTKISTSEQSIENQKNN